MLIWGRLNDRNQAAGFSRRVQSALGFLEPGPASRSRVFAGLDASGAVRAADTRIPAIVQRIIGESVFVDVAPDLLRGPIGERVDLDQMKLRIPRHLERARSFGGLITTDTGYPGPQL